jgi:hypothetical protein
VVSLQELYEDYQVSDESDSAARGPPFRFANPTPSRVFRGTFDLAFTLESSMLSHKFRIGQRVEFNPASSRNVPGGSYEIKKRLPENGGEFEYRIKSVDEPHERLVRESELRRV